MVDASGQRDVPEYIQQPGKAITEDVSVMRGPQAQACIQSVLEEIFSKKLGVYEKFQESMQHPSPTGEADPRYQAKHSWRSIDKEARIVICGNFQEVCPD